MLGGRWQRGKNWDKYNLKKAKSLKHGPVLMRSMLNKKYTLPAKMEV